MEKLKVVVLFDSDPEGWKGANDTIQQWILKDKHVLMLGKAVKRDGEVCMEDLFPTNFFLELREWDYAKELKSNPITEDEISRYAVPQIVKKIEAVMESRGMPKNKEGLCFNKGRVSKKMMEELSSQKIDALPVYILKNFETIFKEINNAMITDIDTTSKVAS